MLLHSRNTIYFNTSWGNSRLIHHSCKRGRATLAQRLQLSERTTPLLAGSAQIHRAGWRKRKTKPKKVIGAQGCMWLSSFAVYELEITVNFCRAFRSTAHAVNWPSCCKIVYNFLLGSLIFFGGRLYFLSLQNGWWLQNNRRLLLPYGLFWLKVSLLDSIFSLRVCTKGIVASSCWVGSKSIALCFGFNY